MNSKDMREDFEKWAENQGFNIKTDGESYYFSDTHNVYMAWRACAELLQSRLESLESALRKANEQAEHFEREWYLRGDLIESLEKDAARYRWMRQLDNAFDYAPFVRGWRFAHTPEQLDATIDAARKGDA